GEHSPFVIVGYTCVCRIFIRSIMFYPSIKTSGSCGLDTVPRPIIYSVGIIDEHIEVFPYRKETTSSDDGSIVIGRETLHYPQTCRVILLIVVERAEFFRAKPLYIPKMEIFVRYKAQEVFISTWRLIRISARTQHRGVEVLESATPRLIVVGNENIICIWVFSPYYSLF